MDVGRHQVDQLEPVLGEEPLHRARRVVVHVLVVDLADLAVEDGVEPVGVLHHEYPARGERQPRAGDERVRVGVVRGAVPAGDHLGAAVLGDRRLRHLGAEVVADRRHAAGVRHLDDRLRRVDAEHPADPGLGVLEEMPDVRAELEQEGVVAEVALRLHVVDEVDAVRLERRRGRRHVEIVVVEVGGVDAVGELQVAAVGAELDGEREALLRGVGGVLELVGERHRPEVEHGPGLPPADAAGHRHSFRCGRGRRRALTAERGAAAGTLFTPESPTIIDSVFLIQAGARPFQPTGSAGCRPAAAAPAAIGASSRATCAASRAAATGLRPRRQAARAARRTAATSRGAIGAGGVEAPRGRAAQEGAGRRTRAGRPAPGCRRGGRRPARALEGRQQEAPPSSAIASESATTWARKRAHPVARSAVAPAGLGMPARSSACAGASRRCAARSAGGAPG